MCRLTLQLLGMLGNVFGMLCNVLGMLCNVLGMLATSSAVLGMFQQGPRSLWYTTPLTSQLIRQQVGGFLFDVGTWWYITPLVSQLIRQQGGGFLFDVGLLGPC